MTAHNSTIDAMQSLKLRVTGMPTPRKVLDSALDHEREARYTGTSDEWLSALILVATAVRNYLDES